MGEEIWYLGMRRKKRFWKAWKVVDGQEKLLLGLQMDLGKFIEGMQGLIYQSQELIRSLM